MRASWQGGLAQQQLAVALGKFQTFQGAHAQQHLIALHGGGDQRGNVT